MTKRRLERILMIRPNMGDFRSKDAMEPLAPALLKSLTPPDIAFTFMDERVEPIDLEHSADLVAITVETFTARRAYQLSQHFRHRGIPVVMGGYHPTLCTEEVQQHADAVVVGDAEGVWQLLLKDFVSGELRAVYHDTSPQTQLHVQPDRSVFRNKRYAPLSLIQHGRGCRFVCDFCSIRSFYGSHQAAYSIEQTVRAFDEARHRRVFFVDDNLFASKSALVALLKALVRYNRSVPFHRRKQWCCQISLDVCRDEAVLDLLAESGCFMVLIGFESLQADNLKEMAKGWNKGRPTYEQALQRLRQRNILVYGTFVFGYANDSVSSFAETVDFSIEQKLCIANFNPLTPMPGSPVYDRLRTEGRLLHRRWWLEPDYHYGQAIFRPEGMTPEQLEQGCYDARLRFYAPGSIASRLMPWPVGQTSWKNLDIAVLANWISRSEIRNKQGRHLGSVAQTDEAYADQT